MAKKRHSERTIRLVRPPDDTGAGVVCFTRGAKLEFYAVKEIPCDIGGRGFAMHRLGLGSLYFVRVGKAEDCSCECLGFLAHGVCKHVQGLLALTQHGAI